MSKQHKHSSHGRGRACLSKAVLCVSALLAFPATDSLAQTYPNKPIRMIVPNAPGGPSDLLTRMIGPKFTEAWGQPVIAENRAGATGLIAAEMVYKAPADGHTMILMALTQLIGTLMHQKYMLLSDFAPVSMVGSTPFAIAVNPTVPVKNVAEWIAYAKARPGDLTYASSGNWGAAHLCMESFNELAGIKLLHVPHPSTPAATNALMGSQVHAFCPAGASVATLAKTGKMRVLGVTYLKPTKLMPDTVPIADTLPGYEMLGWFGLETTKGTPPEVVNKINAELTRILRTPEIAERMIGTGVEPATSTPAEFATFLQRESARWGKFLKDRNAKPE